MLKELFRAEEIFIDEVIPKLPSYPPPETLKRPAWLLAALIERITYISRLRGADVTILQREILNLDGRNL